MVSLETGFSGLDQIFNLNKKQIIKKLKENIPNKLLLIGEAFRKKINLDKIHKLSKIDPWFLNQIKEIIDNESKLKKMVFLKTSMVSTISNQLAFLIKKAIRTYKNF